MPTAATSQPPRTLTPAELAAVVKMFRESKKWSQEQLAEIARLSTRTIQRVENGQPSDLDTRRALGRAFGFEDIDFLNKPLSIPTPEELEAARQAFDREHITLEAHPLISGRQLAGLAEDLHHARRQVGQGVVAQGDADVLRGHAHHEVGAAGGGDAADRLDQVVQRRGVAQVRVVAELLADAG